ncbi:general substrate transporter [Zalerion maritima]|uniref:General substrate transporter n=1 Tax=Zalerion maritima TaxID=339359 RepID=A0AAD5RH37_9PEZI|nr:general substrate transporter [Zalerion maritima]
MAIAMGWQKPDNVAGSSAPAIMVGLFVATGGLLFGYDTGTINGILEMESFRRQFATANELDADGVPKILASQSSIIVAILSAGTFLGALLSSPVADWLGRRLSLIASVGVFSIGAIFQVCASSIPVLLVGRFLAGVGVGAVSVIVPLYQSEMAPKWIRGTLVCTYQLSITLGLLAAAIINILTNKIKSSAAYRIPLGIQLTWAAALALGLLMMPETPRFLIKKGKADAAALSLSRLRRLDITHPALIEELAEIEANHAWELSLGPDTYRDIVSGSPHLGRRTLTGCVLQMLQQLTGVNFIMYYGTTFFARAGVSNAYLISVITNLVNAVSTIPALWVIEAWGRRKLLIVGSIGMSAAQLLIASFTTVAGDTKTDTSNQILVIFVCIYLFFFAASWGPTVWVVTSEIYPLKVRAKAMSVSTSSNWLLNFGIAYGTPYMVGDEDGAADMGSKIFFLWGSFCIISIFFVWFMVFETSRISLEQIDEMYERIDYAWNSSRFEPSWSFQQLQHQGWTDSGIPTVDMDSLEPTNSQTTATTTLNSTPSHAEQGVTNTTTNSTSNSQSSSDAKILAQMGNVDFSY